MNYLELCIAPSLSVRDAMNKLNEAEPKILFVVDEGVLLGALTDGDVRRYLLSGGKLEDEAYSAANHNPICAKSLSEAAGIFDEKNCFAVPVIEDAGKLKDIFVGQREVSYPKLGIPVVINAGGRGTRLDPFTRVLPKPLIPVGDMPIIEHIMQRFMQYGCDEFHIIVNYKKELIKTYFNECECNYNITWYDEEKPLHTGGGLWLLKNKLDSPFFFIACDTLILADYESMLKFHKSGNNSITMACAYKNMTLPYGIVEMGKDGVISAIKEKPQMSFLTNTGMYLINPEVLKDIEDNVPLKFTDLMETECRLGNKVAVFPISENDWLDMGEMKELDRMRDRLCGHREVEA